MLDKSSYVQSKCVYHSAIPAFRESDWVKPARGAPVKAAPALVSLVRAANPALRPPYHLHFSSLSLFTLLFLPSHSSCSE